MAPVKEQFAWEGKDFSLLMTPVHSAGRALSSPNSRHHPLQDQPHITLCPKLHWVPSPHTLLNISMPGHTGILFSGWFLEDGLFLTSWMPDSSQSEEQDTRCSSLPLLTFHHPNISYLITHQLYHPQSQDRKGVMAKFSATFRKKYN